MPSLTGVSSVDVVSAGKNLVDISGTDPDNGYTDDRWLSSINTYNNNNDWHITEYLPILPNTDYTLSGIAYGNAPSVCFYDENKDFISGIAYSNRSSFTFTSPATAKFVRFSIRYDFTAFMMEYGTTATAYAPYVTPTTHTANLGRTIYGGSVDVVNGTGTETAGKSVLDATETWLFSSAWSKTNTNVFYTQATHDEISFSTWNDNSILLCDGTLPVGTRNEINNADTNMIGVSGNVGHPCITVRIDKTTCPDLASFIQYITNNQIPFVYKKATPEDFTFTPVPINSRLGDNTMWSDGDLEVVYRSTGTETIIQPTLVTKAITENGTYNAASDNADGYSSVTVNVPTGATNIDTVLGSNALLELTGVSGTDVTRTMWTRTAAQAETVVFHPNTQVKTNTGANDGYFKVLKNDVVVASTYANTSTTTPLSIPDIDLEAGDVLTISAGFDNNHSSCWFDLYSTITILSSGSAPVLGLGLGNPGPVSEPEQEEEPEEIQEETPEEVDQNESDE